MKMVAEYLEKAQSFERLADAENDNQELKEQLLAQARAYRRLAEKRAQEHNLPFPPQSD